MSTSPPRAGRPEWLPSPKALLAVAAAFAIGLLLFLALWLQQRHRDDFFRAAVPPTSNSQVFAPLPAPVPAGQDDGASGLPPPDPNAPAERPRIVERAPPPAANPSTPPTATQAASSSPIPVSMPSPRYPTAALRRRDTGTVRIRVDVGADGVPVATTVVASSQSRDLDRAALEAVRRWRFQPARAGGRPVAGSVEVPIDFKL